MPGGVCAVLDYEVELMAEYVAEMATRLALGNAVVSAPFRKFVSQILTSTRLPSTTILLGMNYMAKRINMMSLGGQRPTISEGQVWRMLTTAFLLGSKFLDDNTFQNRSWSEVSGIGVQELNTLEHEWLAAINWNLYVNLDRSKDYSAWLKSWKEWQTTKERQKAQASRERLMPSGLRIDTDVYARPTAGYSTWHQQQVAEYERLQSLNLKRSDLSPQSGASVQDGWYATRMGGWSANQAPCTMPLTPPDSGYGTPEYLNSATINSAASHNAQYNDWFSRGLSSGTYSRQAPYQQPTARNAYRHSSRHPVSAHTGYYGYSHNIWDPNVSDCACANCVGSAQHKPATYFGMTHGYGQTVMG